MLPLLHLNPLSFAAMDTRRHSSSSSGTIPFLWEHLPGISKAIHGQTNKSSSPAKPSLPPPPCSSTTESQRRPLARHNIYVPLPPCPFASTRKVMKKISNDDDPFLAAFIECTRCNKKEAKKRKSVKEKEKEKRTFSCKKDNGVRKDVMIRIYDRKKVMEAKEGEGCEAHGMET
ncbi:hypothetical protein MA16_Dca009616 [Dendrobium catenatum]|uniref:Uncharacterized protein n=1 Tax=Dendrobium catenatum TaxID=906689 RepID=A0A2I0VSI5_9ASPA|nr:hypothetical protein MA16_Dca009616 [Dendrobium catenatum]